MAEQPLQDGGGLSDPAEGRLTVVPGWLENLAALSWRILAVVAFAVVAWYLGQLVWTVTASIAVAIVVSAVFAPFVLRLRDGGRSRNAAAGIVWAVAILVIAGTLLLLVVAFLPYLAELAARLSAGQQAIATSVAELQLPDWVSQLVAAIVAASESVGGDVVADIVSSAASTATILLLAAFLVFFFLRDGDKAWLWFFQDLGDEKRERITSAGDIALARVGGYLRGTTVLAGVIAGTNYAFMLLLGVPLALPLAVLSFVATYIPYFGGIVTTIVILVVTYSAGGAASAVAMLLLMAIRSGVVSYLVRPLVYQRTVRIHPALRPHRAAGRAAARWPGGPLRGRSGDGSGPDRGAGDGLDHAAPSSAQAARSRSGLARSGGTVELATSPRHGAGRAAPRHLLHRPPRGGTDHPGADPCCHAAAAGGGTGAARSFARCSRRDGRGWQHARHRRGPGHHAGLAGGPGGRCSATR